MKNFEDILDAFKAGKIDGAETRKKICALAVTDLGHTKIDLTRRARTGAAEVIFGAEKTPRQVLEIARKIFEAEGRFLATRVSEEAADLLKKSFPKLEFDAVSKTARIGKNAVKKKSFIAVVSAGTSDMRVAEEARMTAEFLGSRTRTFYDCGVAGLHRLTSQIDEIRKAKAIIAVAGMEGALASVIAGLVKSPVIAVPTSVGYGASFGGVAALLAMMNSCANGVSVVNIDNGFGAGYNAHLINSI